MALSREKYKRTPDLYVVGKVFLLKDGTPMWLQAVNPLQRQECQSDASVARARLVKALKSDHGSDERAKVEGVFFSDGRVDAINRLVMLRSNGELASIVERVRNDPDWKERLEILGRSSELMSRAPEDAERKLLDDYSSEYLAEITRRQSEEQDYLRGRFENFSDDELLNEYIDVYLDRRGDEVALDEYNLSEIWFAARCCDATQMEDGQWDHTSCESHATQVYETKAEIRALPEDLQESLMAAMADINMSVRDAKNSDRQGSSSDSSPLPSEGAESTPSTQIETPSTPPGSSLSLSGTH